MKQRTPQEKKELSYKKDRRNVYGNAPHAARKRIPLRKAIRNRANRHVANQSLAYQGPAPDEDQADEMESQMKHRIPHQWEKYPDAPLGEVIAKKSRRRKIMRENGGREALITRTYVKREEPRPDDKAQPIVGPEPREEPSHEA
jgi:hypothetical protein